LIYIFTLDFPWLGKCCVLVLLDLYIYFGFPLARLKWSILLKSVRLPLQSSRDGIRECGRQLDHREDGVKAAEIGREGKAVCAMANTTFNDKGA
jgi:hypothetical protein